MYINKNEVKMQVVRNAYENSDFVLFCGTFLGKMKKNCRFQVYFTIPVTFSLPFIVIRSFYMTRNQTR